MISFLFSHIEWVMGALASLVVLVTGAFATGTVNGARKEKAKAAQEDLKAVKNKKAIDDDVAALGSDSLGDRFNRWMRSDK